MRAQLFLLFLFSTIFLSAQNKYPAQALSYPLSIFNSDTCCWRKLSHEGNDEEAAQLILSYYQENKNSVSSQPLYWHVGQCFALAGQNEMAIGYMKKTYSTMFNWFGGEDGITWYYYAKGIVAFLERDKSELERIIEKWEKRFPQSLNYYALEEMMACWNSSYQEINQKEK